MTEIEKLQSEIKVLQAKVEFLQSIEDTKTQEVREAYKTAYGFYPVADFAAGDWDVIAWDAFRKGYETAQVVKNVEVKEQPKPKTPTIYEFLTYCEYGETNPDYFDKQIEIETNAENFVNYLYECCDVVREDDDLLCVNIDKKQLAIPNV